jgi:signal transduction histidine kinase/ligand-binding sensor domain-containing protein
VFEIAANSLRFVGVLGALVSLITPARAITPDRHISQYGHRSWRFEDNYIPGVVSGLTQTTDGYLWLGTESGLWRFDGVRFVPAKFAPGESLPSTRLSKLLGARDGSLWIGTTRGLARLQRGHLRVYPEISADVHALAEAPDGSIWVGLQGPSRNGKDPEAPLCRLAAERLRCFGHADGVRTSEVQRVLVTANGNAWLGSDVMLEHWTEGSASQIYAFPVLRQNQGQDGITGIAQGSDGSIWVSTCPNLPGPRLVKIVNGSEVDYQVKNLDLNQIDCVRLYTDRAGALWLGTPEDGLYRIYDGSADHIDTADGLSGTSVYGIFEDREGTLWVATNNGIDSFYDTRVVRFSRAQGITSGEVDGVQGSRSGAVYISTARGLDVLNTADGSIHVDPRLSGGQVAAILEDRGGELWVGVNDNLYLEGHGGVSRITGPDGRSFGMVGQLTEDGTGDVWAHTHSETGRYLVWLHDGRVKGVFPPEQVPIARSLAGDPNGGVWLGLRNGDLAHFDGRELKMFRFPHDDKAEGHKIILSADNTVFGATSYGLIALRDEAKRVLDVPHGLPCEHLYGIAADRGGNFWISAACGVIELTREQFGDWWSHPEARLALRLFDSADGLQPGLAPFGSAAASADGRLWFANGMDVESIDPTHLAGNGVAPPVHIEQILADHTAHSLDARVPLPALTRDIEIDYTALSLVVPEKVRFRYMLEGHDKGWVEAGGRRQAFYNDLAPGSYTFRVIASNNDGVWNRAGASQPFLIQPATYQTVWFRAAIGLLAVCALWFLYTQRVRTATAQVQARLDERLLERERIARELHDTLLQGFQGLLLRFHAVLKQLPSPDTARPMLEAALDRAEDVLRESRARLAELRPEEDDAQELSEILAQFAKSFADQSSPAFRVTLEGAPRELKPPAKLALIRIGREGIANAFLHAEARTIAAVIVYGASALELRVTDDGKGIPRQIVDSGLPGHWGFANIREDASRIGAQLVMRNNDGPGATLQVRIGARHAYANWSGGSLWARLLRRQR